MNTSIIQYTGSHTTHITNRNENKSCKISIIFCLYSKAEAVDLSDSFKKLNKERAIIQVLAFGTAKSHLNETDPNLLLSIE